MSDNGNGSFYNELSDHIKEERSFNMENNPMQYTKIQWLIGDSQLEKEGMTGYQKILRLPDLAGKISRNLSKAIEHLEEKGIPVYKVVLPGTKKIHILTIDPEYSEAKSRDYERTIHRMKLLIKASRRQLEYRHPEQLELIPDTKRLENKIDSVE